MIIDARTRRIFLRHGAARVGTALLLALLLFALLVPLLAAHDPTTSDFVRGIASDGGPRAPSLEFPLGTDRLFRCQLARAGHAVRLSLSVAMASTALATAIGMAVGLAAGWTSGSSGVAIGWLSLGLGAAASFAFIGGNDRIAVAAFVASLVAAALARAPRLSFLRHGPRVTLDDLLMRLVDLGLSLPFLLLVMALGATLNETSVTTIVLTLGLTGWLGTARIVRAKTLQVRSYEYVTASRALGASTPRLLLRHVVPGLFGPIIVTASGQLASMVIAESALSYLGVGLPPPTPTLGHMLFEGQDYYLFAPWLLIVPGALVVSCVFAFNLIGEGVRDALDPRAS